MLEIEYMGRTFLAEGIKSNKNGNVELDGKKIYLIAGKPLEWMDFCARARIYIRGAEISFRSQTGGQNSFVN